MNFLLLPMYAWLDEISNSFFKEGYWLFCVLFLAIILGIRFLGENLQAKGAINSGKKLEAIISSLKDSKEVSYANIVQECGNPVNVVHSKDDKGEPITEKAWHCGNYEVVLTFDANDILLGVKSETWY